METLSCERRTLDVLEVLEVALREAQLSPGPQDRVTITAHLLDGGWRLVKVDMTRERLVG